MLLFTHRVDRFSKVFGNMEPIMHDAGLGEAGMCRIQFTSSFIGGSTFGRFASVSHSLMP